jgi:hypothetical protein
LASKEVEMPKPDHRFVVGVTLGVIYAVLIRPQINRWGATDEEAERPLPGDDLIPDPVTQITRAVNIDAPPQAAWPWIAQMGRERTGWYGFDLLVNQGVPSATYVRQDLPAPQVGMKMDRGFEIAVVEPERAFVFVRRNMPTGFGPVANSAFGYVIEPQTSGAVRLLVRAHGYSEGLAGLLYTLLIFEPANFLLMSRQLCNVKQRAENYARRLAIAGAG